MDLPDLIKYVIIRSSLTFYHFIPFYPEILLNLLIRIQIIQNTRNAGKNIRKNPNIRTKAPNNSSDYNTVIQ